MNFDGADVRIFDVVTCNICIAVIRCYLGSVHIQNPDYQLYPVLFDIIHIIIDGAMSLL